MKKVIFTKYGPPEVLHFVEAEKPVPKDREVLVKIYATTVTAADWRMRKADPFVARLFNGLFKPFRIKTLGFELAGVVEAVGKKTVEFKPGDEVFGSTGTRFGAYAEYRCLPEKKLALKPGNMSFEEAAAISIGATTALHFLRKAKIKSGDKVMIYGASGSVGTFSIQLAKHFGTTVTGVCSTTNLEMVKSLGADQVIDYTKTDYTKTDERYDIIFDAVGKTSKAKCKHLLVKGGRFVTVDRGLAMESKETTLYLKDLIEKGALKSVIDKTYPLKAIVAAHHYVEQFHKKGNVAVTICSPV